MHANIQIDRELLLQMLLCSPHAALVEAIQSSARMRLPIVCDSKAGVMPIIRLAALIQAIIPEPIIIEEIMEDDHDQRTTA